MPINIEEVNKRKVKATQIAVWACCLKAVDEKTNPGWVKVIITVKGLKIKNEGNVFKPKIVAKNAHIPEPEFTERTVLVKVEGKDELNGKNVQLRINKLPYDIVGGNCSIVPEENRVVVFLKKAESGQSWRSYIARNGIETDDS